MSIKLTEDDLLNQNTEDGFAILTALQDSRYHLMICDSTSDLKMYWNPINKNWIVVNDEKRVHPICVTRKIKEAITKLIGY